MFTVDAGSDAIGDARFCGWRTWRSRGPCARGSAQLAISYPIRPIPEASAEVESPHVEVESRQEELR